MPAKNSAGAGDAARGATSHTGRHPERGAGGASRVRQDDPRRGAARRRPGRSTGWAGSRTGTTISDYDEAEIRQQRSVGLTLAPSWSRRRQGQPARRPGYATSSASCGPACGPPTARCSSMSASEGVDGATKALWQECEAVGMPRSVVISKLNHPRADYAAVLAAGPARVRRQGASRSTCRCPTMARTSTTWSALLSQTVSDYSGTARGRAVRQPTRTSSCSSTSSRGTLIEGIIEESEDEGLMDRYMSGEDIDRRLLDRRPGDGGGAGHVLPGHPGVRATGLGLDELLEISRRRSRRPPSTPSRPSTRRPARPSTGAELRPGRSAGGRGGQDDLGPVRRPDQPGPGLLRHGPARRDGARLRALLRVLRRDRGHEDHDEDERIGALSSPARQDPAARTAVHRGRHLRRSPSCRTPRPATR